jgi:hypothetical protein
VPQPTTLPHIEVDDIKKIKKEAWMGGCIDGYRSIDRGIDS